MRVRITFEWFGWVPSLQSALWAELCRLCLHPRSLIIGDCVPQGEVRYSVEGFLAKNKDPLHEDLLLVMEVSSLHLISVST